MTLSFQKGENAVLSANFTSSEFDCQCQDPNCTTKIDEDLVRTLQKFREALQSPVRINSGFRCQAYQDELRARGFETAHGLSQHQLGRAADIMSEPKTGLELEKVARSVGFMAVGVGRSFIHVDLRNDRIRSWTYVRS